MVGGLYPKGVYAYPPPILCSRTCGEAPRNLPNKDTLGGVSGGPLEASGNLTDPLI